jgi:hypothetical protein
MTDKSFKVKSGLTVPALSTSGVVITDSSGVISSTAIVPVASGGTGQTTANNALNALLPVQNGSTINYTIQSDGSNVSWSKLYNQLVQNNGVSVTPRRILNVVGVSFADNAGTDTTTITFSDTANNADVYSVMGVY